MKNKLKFSKIFYLPFVFTGITIGFSNISNKSEENPEIIEKSVLIIGSTKTGKSTLGNFLSRNEKNFVVGASFNPETQKVNQKEVDFKDKSSNKVFKIKIYDTPGLNEIGTLDRKNTDYLYSKEERNILEIVKNVREMKSLSTIIICFNFQMLALDSQFYRTINYYSKLFKDFPANNIFIVITNYNESSSKKQSTDEELVEVYTMFNETFKFQVNSTTVDARPDNYYEKEFMEKREKILNIIIKNQDQDLSQIKYFKIPESKVRDQNDAISMKSKKELIESLNEQKENLESKKKNS
eukprot:TRINITY_DN2156_c0_g1_i2.p1 TRINITY_DN2156_c0_g1~~TRINITY_DN2156_c0_g1_i2.p1  ORF type:complete len:296 (-),score=74.28 TRINITY_DN2156_c0_g1_i2:23-910(-)